MHYYLQRKRREKERTRGRRARCGGGERETAQRAGHIWWNHVGHTLSKNTLTLPKMLQIHPRQQDTHTRTRGKFSHLERNRGRSYRVSSPPHTSSNITLPTLQACALRTCEGQHNLTRRQDSARTFARQSALDSCYSTPCRPYYKQDVI